jgi:1-acyl-sn-glycerol-3-phosphate acyltransferase
VILLRSLAYYVLMAVTIVAYGLLIGILGWFAPTRTIDRLAGQWARLNLFLQRHLCGLSHRLEGSDRLPAAPFIVMSKHQSAWETIALRGLLPPHQSWVLKQELMRIPFFGFGLRFARSIPIDRSAGRRAITKVVEEGLARLREGRIVIVFPEGTRTDPGQRRRYGIGGAILAERAAVPVVPIAHNAGVFWRRRGVKKYPGQVQVVIGPSIPSDGRKAKQILADVEAWIESTQDRLPRQ